MTTHEKAYAFSQNEQNPNNIGSVQEQYDVRATQRQDIVTRLLTKGFAALDASVLEKTDRGATKYYKELPLPGEMPGESRSLVLEYGEHDPESVEVGPEAARIVSTTESTIKKVSIFLNPSYGLDGTVNRARVTTGVYVDGEKHPSIKEWRYAEPDDFTLFAHALNELEQSDPEPVDGSAGQV
jgi:hypothetical protein